jgi:hypothetical protein
VAGFARLTLLFYSKLEHTERKVNFDVGAALALSSRSSLPGEISWFLACALREQTDDGGAVRPANVHASDIGIGGTSNSLPKRNDYAITSAKWVTGMRAISGICLVVGSWDGRDTKESFCL